MDAFFLIGRILFGALFVASGLTGHLGNYPMLKGFAAMKRIPAPGPAVLVSGIGIVLGGLAIALGIWADLAALGLAVFLLLTAFLIHNFWTVKDDQMTQMNEIVQFQKDLALLGASLVFFAVTAYGGEFGPSLTAPLFDL